MSKMKVGQRTHFCVLLSSGGIERQDLSFVRRRTTARAAAFD
jgi:hypothetical protein